MRVKYDITGNKFLVQIYAVSGEWLMMIGRTLVS